MADVKLKNGYVRVVNNLFDQLFLREFSLKQIRVIMLILRLSYGYNKKYAIIKPKSRFNFANLYRQDINKTINELIDKKVLLNVAEDAYSINKDYDIWEIPYHKFYDDKKFTDLQALQFVSETLTPEVSETLTNNQENVSETLTNNVSETLTGGEVKNLQNLEDCKQNTYNGVSETLTENENLSVKHLQEQGVNSDNEGNTDASKDIIKDNIKTYIKDIHIGEDKKNTPKIDPYFNNPVADKFKAEYKKIFNKSDCYLDNFKLNKLIEINSDNPDFINLIPTILEKFSKITFTKAKKQPTLKWLILDGGWAGILNGEYDQYINDEQESDSPKETWNLDDVGKNQTDMEETWTL